MIKELVTGEKFLQNIKKYIAFTLAETLIVIGIIGVVASLTLPNLNSSTNDKEKVVRVKKAYQNLSEAYGMAIAKYGSYNSWFNGLSAAQKKERFAKRFEEFMQTSKTYNDYPKVENYTYDRDGTTRSWDIDNGPTFELADGTFVCFYSQSGLIIIDIDGYNKGKKIDGEDIFYFEITDQGLRPYRSEMSNYAETNCFEYGDGCATWVIENGNMDYLKADSTGKCTNGTQLSATVTSCK